MAYGYCGTEAKFVAWLQSAFRSIWSKHPSKLTLIQSRQFAMKIGTSKRPVYHCQCYHCKKMFKLKEIEVNHKRQVGGLLKLEDLHRFTENLLLVQPEDLELLCKECHGVVTYMERYGVTRRDAIIEKKCIKFYKLEDAEQIAKCKLAGIEPIPKTKIGRKNAVRDYLKAREPQ